MSANSDSELSQDTVFELLSSPRRRLILHNLRQHGESTINELTKHVAATEYETDVDDLTDQQEKRVYVSLYQTHIPKLADAGIIEYDSDEGIVRLADQMNEIDRFLEVSDNTDTNDSYPWHFHYFILVIAGGLLFSLSLFDLPLVSQIPPFAVTVITLIAFGLSALAQILTEQRSKVGEFVDSFW